MIMKLWWETIKTWFILFILFISFDNYFFFSRSPVRPILRPTSHSKKVDFCQIYRFFLMAHVIEHHVRYRMHYSLFCLRRFFMVLQRFFLKPLPMKKDVFRIIQFFLGISTCNGKIYFFLLYRMLSWLWLRMKKTMIPLQMILH
jgi:hypothetical protein